LGIESIEVAADGVANALAKRRLVVRLSDDRFANGPSNEFAVGRFIDDEDDLIHWCRLRGMELSAEKWGERSIVCKGKGTRQPIAVA